MEALDEVCLPLPGQLAAIKRVRTVVYAIIVGNFFVVSLFSK